MLFIKWRECFSHLVYRILSFISVFGESVALSTNKTSPMFICPTKPPEISFEYSSTVNISLSVFSFGVFFWFDRRGSTHAHYSIILLSIPTLPTGVSLDLSKLFLSMHTHTHTHSIGNTLQHPSLVFSSKYARWFSILMGDEIGRNISLKRNGDVTPSSRKEKTKKVDMQVRRKLMLTRSQKVKTSFIKPL